MQRLEDWLLALPAPAQRWRAVGPFPIGRRALGLANKGQVISVAGVPLLAPLPMAKHRFVGNLIDCGVFVLPLAAHENTLVDKMLGEYARAIRELGPERTAP